MHNRLFVFTVEVQMFIELFHDEYGGEPYTGMMVALEDEDLTGAAFAARVCSCGLETTWIATENLGIAANPAIYFVGCVNLKSASFSIKQVSCPLSVVTNCTVVL